MSEERMKILKLLEEGKITSEEASNLLNSISNANSGHSSKPQQNYNTNSNNTNYEHKPSNTIEQTLSNLGAKLDVFVKDVTPVLKKYSKAAAEKASELTGKISSSLSNTAAPNNTQNIVLEETVTNSGAILNLSGLNGPVKVKGYNGDKISLSLNVIEKKINSTISLNKTGNEYILYYNADAFKSISIDAYIPHSLFKQITVTNNNSVINVSNLLCTIINIQNNNAKVEATYITSNEFNISNSNAKITLEKIQCNTSKIENSNAKCILNTIDIGNLNLSTTNAPLLLNDVTFEKNNDYNWNLNTSNAEIKINTPNVSNIGFDLEGNATFGNIKFNLIGLEILSSEKSYCQAKSININNKQKQVKIDLETTNASISIN